MTTDRDRETARRALWEALDAPQISAGRTERDRLRALADASVTTIAEALAAERERALAPVRHVMTRCYNARAFHAAAGDIPEAQAYDDAGEWIRRAIEDPPC